MFTLTTDTSCDIFRKTLDENNIPWVPLTFTIKDETFIDDFSTDENYKDFYTKVRNGAMPITSQISAFIHEEFFDSVIAKGSKEIVHLTLSGGLSNTYNSAVSGAEASMDKHPHVKIFVVDTLSATQGHCALTDYAMQLRDSGVSGKEAAAQLNKDAANIHHWIVVDDLMHLKRGGRVSGAAAYIGSILNLKPVLIINDEGKLAVVHKSKGTQKAMNYLIDMLKKYGDDIDNQTVYIASADAEDKVTALKKLIAENFKCKIKTGWIGPVIGAHTGAGTLGLVFRTNGRLNNK